MDVYQGDVSKEGTCGDTAPSINTHKVDARGRTGLYFMLPYEERGVYKRG